MKNIGRTITITALALGLTAAPVFCGETETEESNTGEGTGMFGIVVLSDEETDDAAIGIHWLDNTFGNDGTNMFVKSE